MGDARSAAMAPARIGACIVIIRGQKVLLDSDLAGLYAVTTKRLNEQVRRNPDRFPSDLVFQLTDQEVARYRTWRTPLCALCVYGTWRPHGSQRAQFTSSDRSIAFRSAGIRAFARNLAAHADLSKKLDELERKTASLALKHDALAADTRSQFAEVIKALRRLMNTPEPTKRPIGFVTPR